MASKPDPAERLDKLLRLVRQVGDAETSSYMEGLFAEVLPALVGELAWLRGRVASLETTLARRGSAYAV